MLHDLFATWMQFVLDYGYFGVFVLMVLESTAFPVPAEVVDTTGAGDAFAAGFLLGGSLEEAARRALDAAARCVALAGSLPAPR